MWTFGGGPLAHTLWHSGVSLLAMHLEIVSGSGHHMELNQSPSWIGYVKGKCPTAMPSLWPPEPFVNQTLPTPNNGGDEWNRESLLTEGIYIWRKTIFVVTFPSVTSSYFFQHTEFKTSLIQKILKAYWIEMHWESTKWLLCILLL